MTKNERLKLLRTEYLNLTQKQFAENLSISRANLGSIETGRITFTDRVINEIAHVYNVNPDWLKHGDGEVFDESLDSIIDKIAVIYNYSEEDKNHLREFSLLNPEERKAVNSFITYLKSEK